MDKRKLVLDAINHRQPEAVPRDFGSTSVTGIHCSLVAELRDYYGLEKRLVKVFEPFSFLGMVDDDLSEALGSSTGFVLPLASVFGGSTDRWKEWRTPWGQEVLIPADFGIKYDANGDVLAYPQGDMSAPPSGKMPKSSYFIDVLIRQEDFEDEDLDPKDNTEEFQPMSDETVRAIVEKCRIARATGKGVVFQMPGTALGDISKVPAPGLKHPKGIRDIEEWYISLSLRPDYVRSVLEIQAEVGLENIKKIHQAGGDDLCDVIHLCGTDFGTQNSTFCSHETLESVFAPSYRKLCGWIHDNTPWKIFKHTCGSVEPFIQPLLDMGFDILNPVQCSAANMDPRMLKEKYGDKITFWGGGIDTQRVLPFGTPKEVREQVLERLEIFSPGGGFMFATIHNTQARTPLANFVAMIDALNEFDGL